MPDETLEQRRINKAINEQIMRDKRNARREFKLLLLGLFFPLLYEKQISNLTGKSEMNYEFKIVKLYYLIKNNCANHCIILIYLFEFGTENMVRGELSFGFGLIGSEKYAQIKCFFC